MKESIGEWALAQDMKKAGIEFQKEVCLVPGRKYRWDFYLRQKDLAIEVSGQTWQKGGHSSGSGILRDYRKNNAAVLAGLKCLFFTTQQVESGEAIETIKQALGA
jgi:very-short-patch-repair endonuclease